jgi:D-beta-D-heptose 7-phosphate kinase/D-beta-D-heptose 1-phosphate adenosyltransferase
MLDEFVWGRVVRISPEAPVPVVEVQRESSYPGGAANVARNLRPFCQAVHIFGLIGKDAAGKKLLGILREEHILTDSLLQQSRFPTTVKTRIIARQQQLVRVDREAEHLPPNLKEDQILEIFDQLLPHLDGIIFEDYGKGFLNQHLKDQICKKALARNIVIAADPNPRNSLDWQGATVVKPNRQEAFHSVHALQTSPLENPLQDEPLLQVCKSLQSRWKVPQLLVTLGEHGMLLCQPDKPPYHTPTRAREVFDVSGAGDTAIALYTLALCAGASPEEAAEISNHAASIVIGKLGTATLTVKELIASFQNENPATHCQ